MKKNLLLLVLALAVFLTACGGGNANSADSENTENESSEAIEVNDDIEVYGVVKTGEKSVISLPIAVKVEMVDVKAGQAVKVGDTLLTVDLDAITEEMEHIKSQIRTVRNSMPSGTSAYNNANNRAEQIRAEIKLAKEEQAKAKPLLDAGAISASDYQKYADNISKLESNLKAAIYDMQGVNENKAERQQSSENQIEDLEYKLKQFEDAINSNDFSGDKVVVSAGNAIVESVSAVSGAYVPANQELVRLLADQEKCVISAEVPEEYFSKIKIGQKAEITALVIGDEVLNGQISFISQIARKGGSEIMIPIEITLEAGKKIPANSNVDIKIIAE